MVVVRGYKVIRRKLMEMLEKTDDSERMRGVIDRLQQQVNPEMELERGSSEYNSGVVDVDEWLTNRDFELE